MKRISNVQLRKRMKLSLKLHKDKLTGDYKYYMRETAKEAKVLDCQDAANYLKEVDSGSDVDMKAL